MVSSDVLFNNNNYHLFAHSYIVSSISNNHQIWAIDGILIGTTTCGQSGPGSYSNERVLHTPQNWNLPIGYSWVSYWRHFFFDGRRIKL